MHDYHLLLTPKLIRDKLSLALGISGHLNSAAPSPAIASTSLLAQQQQQRGMDWGSGFSSSSGGLLGAALKASSTLGDNLKSAVNGNGNSASGGGDNRPHHHPHNEVMIGLFIHTPWPSSEIFRCLPSE